MTVRDAYTATGKAWEAGPARIYDRLAEVLVDRCPGGVAGQRVLDLGAGTGAASRASLAAGAATVMATDLALGMLAEGSGGRPPACVGDAVALPFADGAFGAVVAAFSLNHLADPRPGLVEAARVLRPGGGLVVSAYAEDDTHQVKEAVEAALRGRGWEPEPWYVAVKADAMPKLATVERADAVAAEAGLAGAAVTNDRVLFDLSPAELVEWRLGMAQVATFVDELSASARDELAADALERLGADPPPLVRSVIAIAWRKGRRSRSSDAGPGR